MRVLALLFAVVALGSIILPPEQYMKCDGSREAVQQCAQQFFDLDHNGNITAAEVQQALLTFDTNKLNLTVDFFMKCDYDEDGGITLLDWNNPNSTCLPTLTCRKIACDVCVKNGFQMTHVETRAKEQASKEIMDSL